MAGGRLETLQAFVVSAREGSFAGAGRRLGYSRDQISKQVAALEVELGARLFRRTTRALQLTPAGAAYLERVEPLLSQLDEAASTFNAQGPATGVLKVLAPATFASRVLMPALPAFLARHPGLEVRFRLEDSASVRVDGVDIWVRISDAVDTEFAVESVGTVGRAVYAAPSYLAAHGIPEQPEDLRTKDSVRYGAMPNPAQWVMSDGERTERIAISGRLAIDLGLALVEAVRAGAGVAVLPDFLAAQGVREGTLQRVLPAWSMSALTVFALVPPSSLDAPKTRAFCAFLREATLRRLK